MVNAPCLTKHRLRQSAITLMVVLVCGFLLARVERAAAVSVNCGNDGPPYLTNLVCTLPPAQGIMVRFDIAGGTSNVMYDILMTTNLLSAATNTPWTRLGQGYACNSYQFTNQPVTGAFFALALSSSANGGPVYLTNLVCVASANLGVSVKLDIAGGTNNALYSILASTNLTAAGVASADWTWLGQGFARKTYNFARQPDVQAVYAIGPPPSSMVIAWGDNSFGQCNVPPGLSNAVAVAGGIGFSLALRGDGTVLAWGDNSCGQTNVPSGLSNVVAISAGPYHSLALRADGSVVAWGGWWSGGSFPSATAPPGPANFIAIAAGADHDLALRAGGTALAWGYTNEVYDSIPANLSGVTALSAGWDHNAAVLPGGSVSAWGIDGSDFGWHLTEIPSGLSNVVAVSASALHTLALRGNGTVAAWGNNADGQLNVPPGLSNVISVAAGEAHSLALKRDGTIAVWGDFGLAGPVFVPSGLSGVTAIGPAANHCLVICAGHSTPIIQQQPQGQTQVVGGAATFSVPSQGLGAVGYQWQLNGTNLAGATNATLTLTNLSAAATGNYRLVLSNAGGVTISSNALLNLAPLTPPVVTAWTRPSRLWVNYQTDMMLKLTVKDPAGVVPSSCAWQFNTNSLFPDTSVPFNYEIFAIDSPQEGLYSAVVSNAAGTRRFSWTVQAAYPGGVALWGADDFGQTDRPTGLTSNVVAVAGGPSNSVALMMDGTVRQWGYNWGNPPANLTNVVAVAAGYSHMLALKGNGTVAAWGLAGDPANSVPTNLAGVQGIAAGWNHNLAMLSNGTVTAWGKSSDGETNVPPGLSNVTAVAAGSLHSLALRADGTVAAWGYNVDGETNVPPGLSNVVAIAGGGQHSLALRADGTVVAWGANGSGQCNVPAGLRNVMAVSAGSLHSLALKNDGTVVAWGDDSRGQVEASANLTGVRCIAAGGYHSLAAIFSPTIAYPAQAAKDLLLIYNTNSANSLNVLNYYLQHRPQAAGANVLGIGCTTNEIMLPEDFNSQIAAPVTNWLAAHPTVRPGYVMLMLDLPSRVWANTNFAPARPSVSCQLATGITNWNPLVTHLNMGDTNDCRAYIDKLAQMGAAYSPGKLLISAGAGGANASYAVDNVRNGAGHPDDYSYCWWFGWQATNALANSGVAPAAVLFTDGSETWTNNTNFFLPHLTNAANVAGYFSWGFHSSLGANYATGGNVRWTGASSWYLISTVESYNGQRNQNGGDGFIQWFSAGAFGGANYLNTPVGAVTHVDEPGIGGMENQQALFGLWSAGRNFAICAWNARNTPYFQAVGDPFVSR